MNSEQWKNGGNCEYCRRKKYCSKPCKENIAKWKRKMFYEMDKATGGIMSHQVLT